MSEARRLPAILVADVVGYSRLAGADGERSLARLRGLRSDLISTQIPANSLTRQEETSMIATESTPARKGLSRRGFLQRSATGFAAAIAITSTGALLNASEAWALDVKGLKPETMKTLILVARDIYPHDKVADRYYAIAMKGYDEKAAGNPQVKAGIEAFVAALDGAAGDGGYVGRAWEVDRVAILKNFSADPTFETIRSGLIASLYNQKEIWPIFGYEGESFSKGGYIHRGFDDITWL